MVENALDEEERNFASRYGIQLEHFNAEEDYGMVEETFPGELIFTEGDEIVQFEVDGPRPELGGVAVDKPSGGVGSYPHLAHNPALVVDGAHVVTIDDPRSVPAGVHLNLTPQQVDELELLDEMKASRTAAAKAAPVQATIDTSQLAPIEAPSTAGLPPARVAAGRTRVAAVKATPALGPSATKPITTGKSSSSAKGTSTAAAASSTASPSAATKTKAATSSKTQTKSAATTTASSTSARTGSKGSKTTATKSSTSALSTENLENVSDSEFDTNPDLAISTQALEEEVRRMQQQQPRCDGDDLIPL